MANSKPTIMSVRFSALDVGDEFMAWGVLYKKMGTFTIAGKRYNASGPRGPAWFESYEVVRVLRREGA